MEIVGLLKTITDIGHSYEELVKMFVVNITVVDNLEG